MLNKQMTSSMSKYLFSWLGQLAQFLCISQGPVAVEGGGRLGVDGEDLLGHWNGKCWVRGS